ncbi:MAG: DUF1641 domain-containing protein [Nitrospirae bacterium]|nr:DUF1641 domain-containing protein [Nitrospirota bacterium]
MSNKNIVVPSNGNNLQEVQLKMAAQIDNLYQRVAVMDGLISDLLPGVQKMTKELNNSINELRYRFERDETLQLLKKVGDNIPTMIQLVEVMEAVKGLLTDVAPAAPKMVHELNDSINALRNRFERDETFELMKKIGDNIPTFLQLIELLEAGKGLAVDLAPAASKMVHELTPAINTLRYALEKDEVLTLIKKAGDNLPVFIKLLDFVERFNATGDLDSNLNSLLAKETKYFLSGLEYSAVVTMKEFMDHPFEPGMKNVVSSLRDPDVQKGMVFMTTLLKNLHNHMLQTVSEAIMSDLIDKDKK